MLCISPTLAPWNQISLPRALPFEKKHSFSLNLLIFSFFLNNLIKIIIGEIINTKLINIL